MVYVLAMIANAMILKTKMRNVCHVNNGECQDELLFYRDIDYLTMFDSMGRTSVSSRNTIER
jgi:hypothetical protein